MIKNLKTVSLGESSGVNVSLYVWDSKSKGDIKEMRERFPRRVEKKGPGAFGRRYSGFFMTESRSEWVIAINLSGKKNPLKNALPHEINHMSDVVAHALGKELMESSELRSTLSGDMYEIFSEVLEKELQG
jgi:hypothetical protein